MPRLRAFFNTCPHRASVPLPRARLASPVPAGWLGPVEASGGVAPLPGCPCLRLSCPPAPAAVGKPRRPKGSRRWAPSVLPEASRAPLFLCLMLPSRTAGGEGGKAGEWGLS